MVLTIPLDVALSVTVTKPHVSIDVHAMTNVSGAVHVVSISAIHCAKISKTKDHQENALISVSCKVTYVWVTNQKQHVTKRVTKVSFKIYSEKKFEKSNILKAKLFDYMNPMIT